MLQDTVYKATYLNAICQYLTYFDSAYLFPKIDSLATIIYPHILAEPDSNQMFPETIFYSTINSMTFNTGFGDIPALKPFITNRRLSVENQLDSIGWDCSTVSVQELDYSKVNIMVYPNPFSTQTTFQSDNYLINATLTIYNCFGQTVEEIKNISGQTIIAHRNNIPRGLYFACLTQDNQVITTKKIIVTD
jgi:hypothetical protein